MRLFYRLFIHAYQLTTYGLQLKHRCGQMTKVSSVLLLAALTGFGCQRPLSQDETLLNVDTDNYDYSKDFAITNDKVILSTRHIRNIKSKRYQPSLGIQGNLFPLNMTTLLAPDHGVVQIISVKHDDSVQPKQPLLVLKLQPNMPATFADAKYHTLPHQLDIHNQEKTSVTESSRAHTPSDKEQQTVKELKTTTLTTNTVNAADINAHTIDIRQQNTLTENASVDRNINTNTNTTTPSQIIKEKPSANSALFNPTQQTQIVQPGNLDEQSASTLGEQIEDTISDVKDSTKAVIKDVVNDEPKAENQASKSISTVSQRNHSQHSTTNVSNTKNLQISRSEKNTSSTNNRITATTTPSINLGANVVTIVAPFIATIDQIYVKPNQPIIKDQPLLKLSNPDDLQFISSVPIKYQKQFSIGQSVNFSIDDTALIFAGQVSKIIPSHHPEHLLIYVHVVPNLKTEQYLKPGMAVSGSLDYGQIQVGTVVPKAAIQGADVSAFLQPPYRTLYPKPAYVWIIQQNETLLKQPIEIISYDIDTKQFLVAGINNNGLLCLAPLPEKAAGKTVVVK